MEIIQKKAAAYYGRSRFEDPVVVDKHQLERILNALTEFTSPDNANGFICAFKNWVHETWSDPKNTEYDLAGPNFDIIKADRVIKDTIKTYGNFIESFNGDTYIEDGMTKLTTYESDLFFLFTEECAKFVEFYCYHHNLILPEGVFEESDVSMALYGGELKGDMLDITKTIMGLTV